VISVYSGSLLNSTQIPAAVGIPNLELSIINDPERSSAIDIGRNHALVQYTPYTFPSSHAGEASILEKWLKDPPTAINTSEYLKVGDGDFWYKNVSLEVFAGRFAMVLTLISAHLWR
jgi:hypothetical protein